jgi:hypothetical protein
MMNPIDVPYNDTFNYFIKFGGNTKKIFFIGAISFFISSYALAKNNVKTIDPKKDLAAYTSFVQDIAVYQESCQNNPSGHYSSKMYDFDFYHDKDGFCVVDDPGSGLIHAKVMLDNEATHVLKMMSGMYVSNNNSVVAGSGICELNMKKSDNSYYYVGTCTTN